MFNLLNRVTTTSTFKQSIITLIATGLTGLLGAIFYISAARALGPANFGLFMIVITVITFCSEIADVGADSGIVKFVNGKANESKEKIERILKLALEIKIAISLLFIILGFILSLHIANLFAKSELTTLFRIGFLGVASLQFLSFSTSFFKAKQKFVSWGSVQVATNLLRVCAIGFLWAFAELNVINTIWVYVALPFFGFLASMLFIPKAFLKVKNEFSERHEFFKFNSNVAIFMFFAAISNRLDTFISARLLSSQDVGFYSAASQLVVIVPQIMVALGTVVSPKFASMGKGQEFISYFKKLILFVCSLSFIGIVFSPIVIYFIPYLYGQEYAKAVPVLFIILLTAQLTFLIALPVHNAILYYYGYPRLFIYTSFGHMILVALLGWYLVGEYGAIGAAVTVLIGMVYNLIVPGIWLWQRIRKEN